MESNRREFIGHLAKGAAVVALCGATMQLSGCDVAADLAKVLALLPAVGEIANTIATVIAGIDPALGVPIQVALGIITTSFAILQNVITTYQANIAGIPYSVLGDLDAAIEAIETQIVNIEAMFPKLSAAVKSGITIGLGAFETILKLLASLIPKQTAAQMLPKSFRKFAGRGVEYGVTVTVIPTRREFATSYNHKMDAAGYKHAHIHVPWVKVLGVPVMP